MLVVAVGLCLLVIAFGELHVLMCSVMRNCRKPCFLGNKNIWAVTRNRWRFEEVGNVYGEGSGWHSKICSMCVFGAFGFVYLLCVDVDRQ